MKEIKCRVFELEWTSAIIYLETQEDVNPSTMIKTSGETKSPMVCRLNIYPFTDYEDVENKNLELAKYLNTDTKVIYLRPDKDAMPKHFLIYHTFMHEYGNFDVLEEDVTELCNGLNLIYTY